jgi:hypothetical protein
VALFGDWGRVSSWLNRLKYRVVTGKMEGDLQRLGQEIKVKVQEKIDSQGLPWEPLKISTVQKKGHTLVYLDQREYRDSIEVQVHRKRFLSLELSVFPKGMHYSGLDMQTLASYLEFGTSKMVARPLWQPVLEEVRLEGNFEGLLKIFNPKVL